MNFLKLHQSAEVSAIGVPHKKRLAELIGNIRGKQQIISDKEEGEGKK